MRLLREWLDQNVNKTFPFANAAVTEKLSTAVFTDMLIQIVGAGVGDVFVKSITNSSDQLLVQFAVNVSGTVIDMTNAVVVPKTDDDFQSIEFTCNSADNAVVMTGELTTGLSEAVNNISGIIELDQTTGRIYDGCIVRADALLCRLVVDDKIIAGDVELVAGDGIEITPEIAADGSAKIYIDVAAYDVSKENIEITSDRDILDTITANAGRAVRSINGIRPDVNGNIDLYKPADSHETVDAENGVSYKVVTATGVTDGVIALTVPGMLVCDEDVSVYTDAVTDNIAMLNERTAMLQEFCTSVETALNFINTQLAQVK